MSTESGGATLLNFLLLAFIRGTTPLMSFYAVTKLNATSLVVALKCAVSLVLFCITTLFMLLGNPELRKQIKGNLTTKSTYWKLCVIGIIQGTAPYLLVVYSLRYMPPTLMAVFMAATPWFTILFERFPCIKVRTTVTSIVILGMLLGFSGLLLTLGPAIHESVTNCIPKDANLTELAGEPKDRTYDIFYDVCLSGEHVALGTLALIAGSFLWATSTIFWRTHKGDIHFTVASLGQNLIGSIISIAIWFAFERSHVVGEVQWSYKMGIIGFLFLGVCSGWLGTLLVQLLSKKIGAKPTNQVLVALPIIAFVEDCIFVKDVITIHQWVIAIEVIGLLMISLGTLLTNLPLGKKKKGQGPLSETLLQTEYTEAYDYNEGAYAAEVGQYQTLYESDHESIGSKEDEEEEEITTRNGSQSSVSPKQCKGSDQPDPNYDAYI